MVQDLSMPGVAGNTAESSSSKRPTHLPAPFQHHAKFPIPCADEKELVPTSSLWLLNPGSFPSPPPASFILLLLPCKVPLLSLHPSSLKNPI